ncbi:MAG: DUF1232 domain-containing protein [Pegethrix bostrychoides GSE-TBD4-15B]|uniref:DUF1232 domain-containing protein n=1 Tax=Pegethrix bostrychoides GSE-TBD4-15B TaxID=2839662 RepID=A0A951PD50_9CYAN|nr:DUF1232 domain-containing protein [Pegethrix bostrychoides GSE-TBD4-15B]
MSDQTNSFMGWYRKLIRDSKYRWLVIVGSLIYLISPIDLLPDVIPIVGQIDDVVIMTLLVSELSQFLMERVKIAKGKNTGAVADQADQTVATNANAVDVNAVQVD